MSVKMEMAMLLLKLSFLLDNNLYYFLVPIRCLQCRSMELGYYLGM